MVEFLDETKNDMLEQKKSRTVIRFKSWTLLPVFMTILAIACDVVIKDVEQLKKVDRPYTIYALIIISVGFFVSSIVSIFSQKYREKYLPKIKFYVVLMAIGNVANLITSKTSWLPVIYFPSWDKILSSYFEYFDTLLKCVIASSRLYIFGVIYGGIAGIISGVAIGWSKRINYWVFPLIRFIGPIPTSVWVPFAIFIFPTLFGASEFIIAMSMAFPIIVLTSSGIQNVSKGYFEVGSTLGATVLYQIVHIAIPAAMPQIFVGIFNGVTMAFMSLMVAELIGVQAGIGWYINWQQKVMSFPSVYAALILLAIMCSLVMKLLFFFKRKLLRWQDGAIRW